ncbi:MAG: Fur family transcriptional regulator [Thermodesulfobacteriota bacterium]|nr:Fur family transcriptional regulator [Thermodesulfobacteriota bacterium]
MCYQCNYTHLLEKSGLGVTPNRLKVLEVIGNNNYPLKPGEIIDILSRNTDINRVTVYRILDLLVQKKLVDRISSGGRSFYYGLAPNEYHQPHPHFYCRKCGSMECLNPESLHLDIKPLNRTFPGVIDNIQVRLDGICKNCLKKEKNKMSRNAGL